MADSQGGNVRQAGTGRNMGNQPGDALRDHGLEKMVLAATVQKNQAIRVGLLKKEFFECEENVAIFKTIRAIISENRNANASTLATELADRDPLRVADRGDDVNPKLFYLGIAIELFQTGSDGAKTKPGTSTETPEFDFNWGVKRLSQLATNRAQFQAATKIIQALKGPLPESESDAEPWTERQSLVANELAVLEQTAANKLLTLQCLSSIPDLEADDQGIPSGYAIDQVMTVGGFPKGQMTLIRAYHKGGKSLSMRSLFYRALEQGYSPLYLTFADINASQNRALLIQAHTGWKKPPRELQQQADYFDKIKEFNEGMGSNGFLIDAYGSSDETHVEDVIQYIKATHNEYGFDMIFWDYAQKISSRDPRAAQGKTAEQNVVCDKISRLCAYLKQPYIIGSQTTLGTKANGAKDMTKNTRNWEEEAGLVIHCKKAQESIEWEILYNRWGDMTPEGGDERLVIKNLTHNYRRHIIEGPGSLYWVGKDIQRPYEGMTI